MSNFIVLPNKFTMALVSSIPTKVLKCPDTAGVLRVKLICAKDMMAKDVGMLGKGKSDPYCILKVGQQKISFVDRWSISKCYSNS